MVGMEEWLYRNLESGTSHRSFTPELADKLAALYGILGGGYSGRLHSVSAPGRRRLPPQIPGGSQILADGSAEPSVFSYSDRIFSVFS